ncbi:polysaccharide deacetylase family protein [Cellulosimicrobium funkei]|uniref:polysaccharide deacetylase family protein n=1 Tax=Cellulosimicrobium TaxID=157920 RepID=UPI0014596846|nr:MULTISPECIES: polysaccharide deacetylase family protein [Cellulosimicrobium]MCM3534807.1 polysaccharide deacetylase family protein [Cellulosimicrobium funkei]NMF30362.1 polysaccharide deacetylase family protein [Cellulosimicrobium aquatile]
MSDDPGDTTSPVPDAPRRRRRVWWWLVPLLLVVVAAAVVVVGTLEHRAWVAAVERYDAEVGRVTQDATDGRARAEAAYLTRLVPTAAAEVAGAALLAASEGQVDDPAVREPLAATLQEATALRTTPVTYPEEDRTVDALSRPNPLRPGSRPAVHVEVVTGSEPTADALDEAATAVVEAAEPVATAQRQWAYDGLEAAATEGRPVLTESAGLVSDEGTRTTLDGLLTQATTTLDAGPGGAPVAETVALRDAVLAATEAVWSDRLALQLAQRRDQARATGVDCAVERCVALTFDDGPGPDTERLLQVLAEKHVSATFFLVGSNVEKRPDVVRDTAAAGHLLANHTWDHPQLTTLDDDAVRDELARTQAAIESAAGVTPTLLRPPYGDVDDRVRSVALRSGLQVVLWNLDTLDWKTRDAAETRRRAVEGARPGSVVLMHDIHASTVDAVPGIVDDLRAQGYRLVTVDLLAP